MAFVDQGKILSFLSLSIKKVETFGCLRLSGTGARPKCTMNQKLRYFLTRRI